MVNVVGAFEQWEMPHREMYHFPPHSPPPLPQTLHSTLHSQGHGQGNEGAGCLASK